MALQLKMNDMRFHALHGCFEQENKVGGEYRVDLQLDAAIDRSTVSDDLNDTVDYGLLAACVRDEMERPSKLIEQVGARIAQAILSDFPKIGKVVVRLQKLNPPGCGELFSTEVIVEKTRTETIEWSIEERVARAEQLFMTGMNCSQSVVGAYADLFTDQKELLLAASTSLGGGMGRMRELCGTVSGAALIVGLKYPATDPTVRHAKGENYLQVQHLAEAFSQENGSIRCHELLELPRGKQSPMPEERTAAYYSRRPCVNYVASAARILGKMLKSTEPEKTTNP